MTSARALRNWACDFWAQQDTLDRRLFWVVFAIVEAMVTIAALMMFLEPVDLGAIVTRWACVYAFLEFMVIAKRTNRYRECYMAMCLIFNCIFQPINFFYCGGVNGAVPLHYLVGLFMCSFVMSNVQKRIAFFSSLAVMLGTIIAAYLQPQYVDNSLSRLAIHANVFFSLIIISITTNAISSVVVREYRTQRYKEMNNGIIDVLSTVVESRSVESGDHVMRIKGYTGILLEYVNEVYGTNFSADEKAIICSASAMHDVGKIAIPDSILLKPGRFTPEEFEAMKKHTVLGCDIIASMEDIQDKRYYKYSYEICRYHHERYDGKGYPEGLSGEDIPLAAQIVSLADVYDALVNKRCYKKAFSFDKAYEMITKGECGTFSPKLLECFRLARAKMEAFANEPFVNPLESKFKRQ